MLRRQVSTRVTSQSQVSQSQVRSQFAVEFNQHLAETKFPD
jgi:hypothetical protein